MKTVTVIADDFGLASGINRGIVDCAKEGLIQGTAMLMNAPATEEALSLLPQLNKVQVGLHLSIVEGFCLSRKASLQSEDEYFPGAPCLHLNWKRFIKLFLSGKIDLKDLEEEFEAQASAFVKKIGPIPFLNGTQHLHMLPGVLPLVLDLCRRYKIPRMRVTRVSMAEMMFTRKRALGAAFLDVCHALDRGQLKGIEDFGTTYGVTMTGDMDERFMDFVVERSRREKIELVAHPGYNDEEFRKMSRENYQHMNWEKELNSLRYLKGKLHG